METNTSVTIQRAITPKLLRFRVFRPVLFERGQHFDQDECIFMQFNSNCRPGAPRNKARKLKNTVLEKIKKSPSKGLN